MGSPGLKLGRVHGIDVDLDVGVLPLLGILSVALATGILPEAVPGHVSLTYWSVAIVVAVLFVVSLLLHELAHSLVADRLGIGVRSVRLWFLGGVSELDSEPRTPEAQFAIAIAGPLASLLFGVGALAGSWLITDLGGPSVYVTALKWLGIVNIILGVFNLLPGVPLDGGHILAAIIWKLRADRCAGAIGASVVGRILGMGVAAFGLYELSVHGTWVGVWNVMIGVMLHQSALQHERFLRLERALGETTVLELMDSHPRSASSTATVSQVIDAARDNDSQSAVPILNWSGRVVAVVELSRLNSVPKSRWGYMTALDATEADPDFVVASPDEKVAELLVRLGRQGRRHAVVIADGNLLGLIGPEQIVLPGRPS